MQHDTLPMSCRDCGADYVLQTGEIDFYVQRGLSLPRRCVACRRARREREAQAETNRNAGKSCGA